MLVSDKYFSILIISPVADIDECDSNPCQNGATCNDLVGEYRCDCVNGTTGVQCETGRSGSLSLSEIFQGR